MEQYRERMDKLASMTKPIFHRRTGVNLLPPHVDLKGCHLD